MADGGEGLVIRAQARALTGRQGGFDLPALPPINRLRSRGRAGCYLGKRVFDVAAASAAIIVLSPVIAATALLVALTSRGPILHFSTRVGRNGRLFQMPKFRSMVVSAPVCPRETSADHEQCLTSIGRILRRTALDELPQLWSILRGDMSFVGPRPLLASDPCVMEREKFPASLDLRPGLSGLAQVRGRNLVSPRRKARLDALYARKSSIIVDVALITRSVGVLISGRGFR